MIGLKDIQFCESRRRIFNFYRRIWFLQNKYTNYNKKI